MKLLYFTGNMGFCSNLLNILRAMEYASQNNMDLEVCCDFGMHGNFSDWFDFGPNVHFVSSELPGFMIPDTPERIVAHPHWDNSNPSLVNFEKILKTEIKKVHIVPKIDIPQLPCKKYDAMHIRRGDAMTSGEGCKYFHAIEFMKHVTCDDIFVMSDDHRVLDEFETDKKIHHMIPSEEIGNWSTPNYRTNKNQPIFMFQTKEYKNATIKRLIQEMYIASRSQKFICTNSCVAHFVSLIHERPENCINLQSFESLDPKTLH